MRLISLAQIPQISLCCLRTPVNTDRGLSKCQDYASEWIDGGGVGGAQAIVSLCGSNVYVKLIVYNGPC